MKTLDFGSVRFDRNSIPAELRDLSLWPTVDESALDENELECYCSRRDALVMFVSDPDVPLLQIEKLTGVQRREIYRIFARCILEHADGRLYGFRGAVRYLRIKRYQRIVPIPKGAAGQGIGATGAFLQLLEKYPDLQRFLNKSGKRRGQVANGKHEVRQAFRRIHKEFIQKCRDLGIASNEYPFNQDLLGIRSLATYLRKLREVTFEAAAADAGAEKCGRPWPASVNEMKPPIMRAFEAVEFDGHKIDLRLTLKVIDPFGLELLFELHRIWILVIVDIATRAILGYFLALGKEYNKDDVAEVIQAALTPHKKKTITIPGVVYRASGGFPSELFPQAEFACWENFRFDNAKSHLAETTLARLTEVVGCWTDAGPFGSPNDRPIIERFFGLIARHFAHRVTGTTGNRPDDIVKMLGDPDGDVSLLMRLDELEELVDVVISDYNGEAHDGIGGRTPLEAMRQMLGKPDGHVRCLTVERRNKLCLLQDARVVTIRGSFEHGTRPHIKFEGVRYSSDLLSSSAILIGKEIRIYFNVKDLRFVNAFYPDGTELGVLMAARPWCFTPHSLRMRKEILRLRRLGKLMYEEGDDAVQAYVKHKRAEAGRDKRAANDLAKVNALLNRANDTPSYTQTVIQQPSPEPVSSAVTKTIDDRDAPIVKPLHIKRTVTF